MTIVSRYKIEWVLIVVLLAGVGCLFFSEANLILKGEGWHWELLGVGFLILMLALVVTQWSHRRSMQRTLDYIEAQVDQLSNDKPRGRVLVDTVVNPEIADKVIQLLSQFEKQIKELRQANHSLHIREQIADMQRRQTEQILLFVSDAVFVTSRFDELVFANESAEHLMGFHLTVSKRKNIDEIIQDGAIVRLIQDTRRLGVNHPPRVVEHSFHVGKTPCTFRIRLHCLAGPNKTTAGVVIMLHDMTREKEIEQGKIEFVANVSHELKTPLASIKAYVEMLLDGEVEDPESIKEFYETISTEANRLHRMIERILAISRIESNSTNVMCEPVSMTAVTKQIIKVLTPKARAKEIAIEENLAPVYFQVNADYDLIYQAVQNLLVNAIKYTPKGGHITVDVAADERRGVLTVEISDTGVGIPADELPKIFEKFYRGRSHRMLASGSGLGLPLVQYIVETVHGGKLFVTSEAGKGSTFSFELPLVA